MAEAVSLELQHEIEQFLYLEAALLDEGKFHEWLAILADDIHYWMPTRYNRAAARARARVQQAERDRLLRRGQAEPRHARQTPRHGHGVGRGPAVAHASPGDERAGASRGQAASSTTCRRTSCSTARASRRTLNVFAGRREDVLRKTKDGWRIAKRTILLDQNVVLSKNLSVFF